MDRHKPALRRDLRPRSRDSYARFLERAFRTTTPPFRRMDRGVASWPDSCRAILRAAVTRAYAERGLDPTRVLAAIPRPRAKAAEVEIPGEDEALAYERATNELAPAQRAIALLPLAVGLRAESLLTLTRDQVERAAKYGELFVQVKGGKRRAKDVHHAQALFAALLEAPAFPGRELARARPRAWRTVGEILSAGGPNAQYQALRRVIRRAGATAGFSGMRPHLLRHAFATRMNRDGASTRLIQAALDHAQISTTERYIHPEARDVVRYVRRYE